MQFRVVYRAFYFHKIIVLAGLDRVKKVLQKGMQALGCMKSAGNEGVLCGVLRVLPVHVLFVVQRVTAI